MSYSAERPRPFLPFVLSAALVGACSSTILPGQSGSSSGTGGGSVMTGGTGGSLVTVGTGSATTTGSTTGTGGSSAGGSSAGGSNAGGSSAGGSSAGGSDGGCAGVTTGFSTRTLTKVLGGAPWNIGQAAAGIAADAQDQVYLTDTSQVYAVQGTAVSTYLALQDVSLADSFWDLDLGPDGKLYVSTTSSILQSAAPHQADLFRDIGPFGIGPNRIGVASPTLIGVVIYLNGMYTVTDEGATRLYGGELQAQDCATEDLAVARSGVFVYQMGCNGSPIQLGDLDGSGIASLLQPSVNALDADNYLCSGRDPAGGFFTVYQDTTGASQLVHFDECFTDTTGFTVVPLSPTLASAAAAEAPAQPLAFEYCALAVSPKGTIFIQTFDELWRVDP